MTIIFRYLAREITVATLLLLIALIGLFFLFDLIRELQDLGKGNYQIATVLAYVALLQPTRIVVIFPIATLMGTLFAISRLSAQSELTVMRTSGLSLAKLAYLSAAVGTMFSLAVFAFGEFIAPSAEELAKRVKLSATSTMVAQEFRTGFWIKDDLSFVNIQTVTADTTLLNLRIYEFDRDYRLTTLSAAKRAVYENTDHRWKLEEVEKTVFSDAGAKIEKLPTAVWNASLTPELLSVLRVAPSDMSVVNLNAYIDHLRENKQSTARYEIAFWGKILQPAAVIIMMMIAIPFGVQSHRAGGVGAGMLVGIMIGLAFYFMNQLASHLTVLNDWPPLMSAALPLIIFLAATVGLLMIKEYATRMPHWRTRMP